MKTWHLCWYVINSGVSHSLTDWGDAWFHRLQNFLFLRAEVTMQWHVIPGSGWQCSAPNKKSKKKETKTMPSDGARAPLNISNHEVVDNLFYFCFLLSFSPQPGVENWIFFVLSPQMIFVPYLHCVLLFLTPPPPLPVIRRQQEVKDVAFTHQQGQRKDCREANEVSNMIWASVLYWSGLRVGRKVSLTEVLSPALQT